MFSRFIADRSGSTPIEYVLIALLIAVVLVGVVQGIGYKLSGEVDQVSGAFK